MNKVRIKTGDTVRVIAGESKGKEGKVQRIFKESNKAVVEGVNLVSKHEKPSASNPQGGIIEKEAALHISNLSLIDTAGKTTRVGYRVEGDKKVRYAKSNKEQI